MWRMGDPHFFPWYVVCQIQSQIFTFIHSVSDHFHTGLFWLFWICSSTLLMLADIFQRAWTLVMSQMSNLQLKVPPNWRASALEKPVGRLRLVLLHPHDWIWLKKSCWEGCGLIFLRKNDGFLWMRGWIYSFFFGSCSLHFKYGSFIVYPSVQFSYKLRLFVYSIKRGKKQKT